MDARLPDWDRALEDAAESARQSLVRTRPFTDDVLLLLRDFGRDVVQAAVPGGVPENVRESVAAFGERSDALKHGLDALTDDVSQRLSESFGALERDVRFTTVMLFGRTRAGKSTTMEALTRGDGASIGVGRQHTTTETTAYFYPPPPDGHQEPTGPALRIVDTPGIEGFDGDSLGAMAEAFVERADHVLFLVSDDKASADELRRFGQIQTQGKAVTVVLNVKKTDGDLDLLSEAPEYVFDPHEIDGHRRRISGFLADHFGMEPPPVVPVHARAAWLSRRPDQLPDDYAGTLSPGDLPALEGPSGIADLERRLHNFVCRGALAARLRAPGDLLHSYLDTVGAELRPYVQTFRDDRRTLVALGRTLDRALETAEARVTDSIRTFRPAYDLAAAGVDGFVDDLLSARSDAPLAELWERFLRDRGVLDLGSDFQAAAVSAFAEEVAEGVRTAAFDAANLPGAEDAEGLLEDYHADADGNRARGYGRAAIKTAGGLGAGALATWAVANFWNPTGWAAAAGALVVVVGGGVGTHLATEATDGWSREDRVRLSRRRAELIASLKGSLYGNHRQLVDGCGGWVDRTAGAYREATADVLRPVAESAGALRSRTLRLLGDLDALGDRVDRDVVASLLALVCPEASAGDVRVVDVARSPGTACVVRVQSDLDNVLGRCIGSKGSRVNLLRRYLSGERVTFVDADAPFDVQVGQALGLQIMPQVSRSDTESAPLRVLVPPDLVGRAIGAGGVTVRLAGRLLDTPLSIDAV